MDNKKADSKKANNKVVNGKIVYSKDIGNRKADSEKVGGFPADFALSLLLLSIKSYKKNASVHIF